MSLRAVQDFEKTFARQLRPDEFYYNPQVGFLSLNQPLQPDEVLAVAFQYSFNGKIYKVGEFSQDVPPDTTLKTPRFTKSTLPEIAESNIAENHTCLCGT